jgi:aspartate aminotransferase-like enzyme/GNAT superfamily N-acetyltransferase
VKGLRDRRSVWTATVDVPATGEHDGESASRLGPYLVKRAVTEVEFDQVHRLSYETFVREIPQHPDPGTGLLVDKFHHKNTYWIALHDGELVGMVAAHDQPPFSVADRLPGPVPFDRPGDQPLEVRLLAVRPGYRRGPVFPGLLWALYEHARRHGHTRLLISGFVDRVPIYEKLGFRALGPAVACGRAAFVPMSLDLERPPAGLRRMIAWWQSRLAGESGDAGAEACSLLPGPVQISWRIRHAWNEPAVSHRSDGFIARFENARGRLARMVGGGSRVALFCGSGTLANDVVAATLASDHTAGAGLILVNGEFGARLTLQARRFGLRFRVLRCPWGRPWDLNAVAAALATDREVGWIWGVHLETSTGMLNDLEGLRGVAARAGVQLCLDCHLASASSGKALGAFAGLGIVFAGPEVVGTPTSPRVPTSLDLRAALACTGPRYTMSSPLLAAFDRSLDVYTAPDAGAARFAQLTDLGQLARAGLRRLGIHPVADESSAAPVVTTFAPPGHSADAFASVCRSLGYEIAHASDYLRRRGWAQIATMGAVDRDDLLRLFDGLARRLGGSRPGAGNVAEV